MTFSNFGKGGGFSQSPRKLMDAKEAQTAILAYKGEHFNGIGDLLKRVNADNRTAELPRIVARSVLDAMGVNSTKPFTIPG
jgi:hypothetical protein